MQFTIKEGDQLIEFNDNNAPIDFIKIDASTYHVIHKNKTYKAQIIHADLENKKIRIGILNQQFDLTIEDSLDHLIQKMGFNQSSLSKNKFIKAPMPGLVLELKVNKGDEVKAGYPLLILEAMKMENVIKSDQDGTIKRIEVQEKETVEKNQVLIEFE